MNFVDYYAAMELEPTASADEIKRAYRKLARRYHPDVSKEDDAEERFKALGEAYAVLKSPEKREEYDALRELQARGEMPGGHGGFRSAQGRRGPEDAGFGQGHWQGDAEADFSEFFREVFGEAAARGRQGEGTGASPGGHRSYAGAGPSGGFSLDGEDVHSRLEITLQDAHQGARIPLTLRAPVRTGTGSLEVEERSLQVRIPVGVTDGQRIRLRGQGGPGVGSGNPGDLYIEIALAKDPRFALDGRDVTLVLPVSPWEAALGASIPVPTLGGDVRLTVPPGSSGGSRLRLKGRGLAGQPAGEPAGDQFVVLRIELPLPTNDEQRAAYEQMRTLWQDFSPRDSSGNHSKHETDYPSRRATGVSTDDVTEDAT